MSAFEPIAAFRDGAVIRQLSERSEHLARLRLQNWIDVNAPQSHLALPE
jgi:hypothetical protein